MPFGLHPMSFRPGDIKDLTLFEFDQFAATIDQLVAQQGG